jgi:hypothetical protein
MMRALVKLKTKGAPIHGQAGPGVSAFDMKRNETEKFVFPCR